MHSRMANKILIVEGLLQSKESPKGRKGDFDNRRRRPEVLLLIDEFALIRF